MTLELCATDPCITVIGNYVFQVEAWVVEQDTVLIPTYIRLVNVDGYTKNLPGQPNCGTDFLMRRVEDQYVPPGQVAHYMGNGFELYVVEDPPGTPPYPTNDPAYEAYLAEELARGEMAFEPEEMKCYECAGFKGHDHFVMRKVAKLGRVVAKEFDATQTYVLECGHIVI